MNINGGGGMGGIQASTDYFFFRRYMEPYMINLQGGGDQYLNKSA